MVYAKAMLFVDDDKAEIMKRYFFLYQRMRADDYIHFTIRNLSIQRFSRCTFYTARQQANAYAK